MLQLFVLFVSSVVLDLSQATASWVNSSVGIHSFLTFDAGLSEADIRNNPFASTLDFVWGASSEHISAYRASRNPNTVLSAYIPFDRDPNRTLMQGCTGPTPAACPGLAWYQKHRPDWVLYQCDRVTPAWQHYAGESWAETALIPLDVSNPAVRAWQVEVLVRPAVAQGYDAMAWDNFGLTNNYKACGAYRNGHWQQMYGEQKVRKDGVFASNDAYAMAMLDWLQHIRAKVNSLRSQRGYPVVVIPNFSLSGAWNSSWMKSVAAATDGILDEAGYSNYGCSSGCTTGSAWVNKVRWSEYLQAHGVAYFVINEVGDSSHPSRWRLPCAKDPLNCITKAKKQYLLSSYLMGKGPAAGLFISNVQVYGYFSACTPECHAKVGVAVTEATMIALPKGNVWIRNFSSATVVLNPGTVPLDVPLRPGVTYTDLYGNAVHPPVSVPGENATVLLHPN